MKTGGIVRTWKYVACIAALATVVAACGSDDEAEAPDAGADGEDAEDVEPDEDSLDDPLTLRMGVVPADTVEETFGQWNLFIELLEADLGESLGVDVSFDLFEATDLAAVIESAIANDLDIVHLGPFAQVIARDRGAEITTVGATSPDADGPRNAAVAAVRADSDLESLEDLVGLDVCFISPSSTTGYLFGAAALDQLGIDPENDVNAIFIGDHASAMRTMFDGECAATFTFRENAEALFAEEEADVEQDDLRIIFSEVVPEGGVSISTNLPEIVQQELREAMLALTGDVVYSDGLCPEDRVREDSAGEPFCAMVGDGFWGLWPADDSYWEPVRAVCEATNAPACS